jgi:NADH dehydrogenase FAD-containing subunit
LFDDGTHAARNILKLSQGRESDRFRYLDKGSMATIGRSKAVADLKIIRFGGFLAYARGARLIYGSFSAVSGSSRRGIGVGGLR